ncbi:MAG: phosphoribosylanthranilate isomerase [Dehalobacterium sp.]
MTWIKICGITNLADAQLAVSLGVNALGFIFTSSKRQVKGETVREIVSSLPQKVEKIGVFLDQAEEEVKGIAEYCGLTGIQFHGSEPPEYCKKFSGYRVIKAFRINQSAGWDKIPLYLKDQAINNILLDTFVLGVPGGTGMTFPWELVRSFDFCQMPVIMAGGINPSNVNRAISEALPFGIDVGSGVEEEPGRKDPDKLRELVSKVRYRRMNRYGA